jgi:hypothetical protein
MGTFVNDSFPPDSAAAPNAKQTGVPGINLNQVVTTPDKRQNKPVKSGIGGKFPVKMGTLTIDLLPMEAAYALHVKKSVIKSIEKRESFIQKTGARITMKKS